MSGLSDLSLERKECPKCGAIWLNGQHIWATGAVGNEKDLAGLVCNMVLSDLCINPKKGVEGGDTWAARAKKLDQIQREIDNAGKPQWDSGIFGMD